MKEQKFKVDREITLTGDISFNKPWFGYKKKFTESIREKNINILKIWFLE